MSTNEFRGLAAKIDQHMQQLSAQGVNDAHAIINRMLGNVSDLHKIWVGTSDDQVMALSTSDATDLRTLREFVASSVGVIERVPAPTKSRSPTSGWFAATPAIHEKSC